MKITWHGNNCFTLKGDKVTVVTDPHREHAGLKLPRLSADIVTVSDSEKYNNIAAISGDPKVIDWPGEYEMKEVFLKTVETANENAENKLIFTIDIDGIRFCHLSDLNADLSDEMTEEIGNVDVLLVPVGGKDTLDAKKAHEAIEKIDPKVIVPMHYKFEGAEGDGDTLDKFLKEMGEKNIEEVESITLKKSQLPVDTTQFVVLKPVL